MRLFFPAILMFNTLLSDAQLSSEEIKKYHIYKIIEKDFEGRPLKKRRLHILTEMEKF